MATNQVSENPPTNSNPPQPAADPSQTNVSSSKRKPLKIAGIVAAVLLVLLLLIGAIAGNVPKYSTADLVTETKDNISFSRPAQWKNASNSASLEKSFGLDVSNALIFGDKITKDKNGEDAITHAGVIFGLVNKGDPADIALFKDPAVRAGFEKTMDSQFQESKFKSSECQSIEHFSKNYNYDLNNFPVSIALNFNCQLSDSAQKERGSKSTEVRMAIVVAKDGNTYVYVLFASDKSWAKNEPVYLNMLQDLRAQP